MNEYKFLIERYLWGIDEAVNEMIRDGWELVGVPISHSEVSWDGDVREETPYLILVFKREI